MTKTPEELTEEFLMLMWENMRQETENKLFM